MYSQRVSTLRLTEICPMKYHTFLCDCVDFRFVSFGSVMCCASQPTCQSTSATVYTHNYSIFCGYLHLQRILHAQGLSEQDSLLMTPQVHWGTVKYRTALQCITHVFHAKRSIVHNDYGSVFPRWSMCCPRSVPPPLMCTMLGGVGSERQSGVGVHACHSTCTYFVQYV